MKERGWTPDQVDAMDVDEWHKIVAFEFVLELAANPDAQFGGVL